MPADLMPFDNGEFRLDVEPHDTDGFRVSAEQLARALSTRGRDLVRSIPDAEKGRALVRTPGGEQESWYLTEAGFYRAIGQRQAGRIDDSDVRAQVERFQAWVFGTVLPGMRRGVSISGRAQAELVTKADLARMVLEVEEEKVVMAAALESAAPAIAYHDRYVANGDAATVKVWAAQFGLTQPEGFALLLDHKLIYRVSLGERWSESEQRKVTEYEYRAYAKYLDWFDLRPQHHAPRHHNGQVRQTLYIRQQFALQIAEKCGVSTQLNFEGGAA